MDIDKLSEEELIELNNRIVQRLRFLQQARAHASMLKFNIGARVTFTPDGRRPVVGVLTKYNRKTVTVVTEDGQRWNVSPHLLESASTDEESAGQNVIPIRRRTDQ